MQQLKYHFSIDDVCVSLHETYLSQQPYTETSFFKYLHTIYKSFACNIDLYCFSQWTIDNATVQLTDLNKDCFSCVQNFPWLRFGPHGLNYETPPFTQEAEERRLFLSAAYSALGVLLEQTNFSRSLRLHYFSESFDLIPLLAEHGIKELLLTDKDSVCYTLGQDAIDIIRRDGFMKCSDMILRRSNIRVEVFLSERWSTKKIRDYINNSLDQYQHFELFTHEIELVKPEVQDIVYFCLTELHQAGATSV